MMKSVRAQRASGAAASMSSGPHATANIPVLSISLFFVLLMMVGSVAMTGLGSFSTPRARAQAEGAQVGQLRLADGEESRAGDFVLQLAQIPDAPAGQEYVLWMTASDTGDVLRLAAFDAEDGRVDLAGGSDENLLLGYDTVLVSLEAIDAEPENPGEVVFTGTVSPDLLVLTRRFLYGTEETTGSLAVAGEQIALAAEHNGFLIQSVLGGDLPEALRHAEHIVNILDGETGEYFGDLDRDGQIQNPGDGIGVRVHLEEVHDLTLEMLAGAEDNEALTVQAQQLVALLEDSRLLVAEAQEQVLDIFAATADQELLGIATELQITLTLLTHTKLNAYNAALSLATYDLYTAPSVGVVLSPAQGEDVIGAEVGERVGEMRLAGDETRGVGGFVLEVAGVPEVADGQVYGLWLESSSAGEVVYLGELEVVDGAVTLAGEVEESLLAGYDRVVLSVEEAGEEGDTPGEVVAVGTVSEAMLAAVERLLVGSADDTAGSLAVTLEQVELALEHKGFLAQELAEDDLAEVRRHAEHIVNILDGETGVYFGDLDRDGQIQNPGDGFGVRVHLELAQVLLGDVLATAPTGHPEAGSARTLIAEGETLTQAALDQTLRIFAADTVAEGEVIAEELEAMLVDLHEAVQDAYAASVGLVVYELHLLAPAAPTTAPDEESSDVEGAGARVGELRLAADEASGVGGFVLEVEGLPEAADGEVYALWLTASTSGETLLLGELEVENGSVSLAGEVTEELLGGGPLGAGAPWARVVISLEEADAEMEAPTVEVAAGTLSSDLGMAVTRLLVGSADDTTGALRVADGQIALAVEHNGFLLGELAEDDLAEARRHAEHIVNILDGETGVYFGDLDRDGQIQNPGDGFGVRVHLELAQVLMADLEEVAGEALAPVSVEPVSEALAEGETLTQSAIDQTLRIFAADTVAEGEVIAQELDGMLAALHESVQDAYAAGAALVVYELHLLAPAAPTTAPDEEPSELEPSEPVETTSSITVTLGTTATALVTLTTGTLLPPPPDAEPGDEWEHPGDGGVYVYVPGGEVELGSDSEERIRVGERPAHAVEVAGFWMKQTEVTNAEYGRCVEAGACSAPGNGVWEDAARQDHPVTHVTWEQANAYAAWVGGRLPTEAEWEHGCQGPAGQEYPWGEEAPTPELSNFHEHVGDTVAVGSYPEGASPFGLLDMSGNVWEWTSSLDQPYPYVADDGREDVEASGRRIGRGGSFYYTHHYLHCSARIGFNPVSPIPHLGFRTVLPIGN